jgi:hypothetical protein
MCVECMENESLISEEFKILKYTMVLFWQVLNDYNEVKVNHSKGTLWS